ncbi:hypothetical protein VTJ49DRAFT_6059 [Mycothermus thermophilus]|uniref:J domain-containing protein n=1 Tax=Humicola insolens TaxID=85995 RepID=A0ABR3VK04_HUMIN
MSTRSRPPNYCRHPPSTNGILEVSETATAAQIRDAYKRAALKTHPDRVPQDHPDRASRTRRFQLVNDAYFVLSDPARRREYDYHRKAFTPSSSPGGKNDKKKKSSTSTSTSPGAGTGTMPGAWGSEDAFAEAEAAAAEGGTPGAGTFFSWAWDYFMRSQSQNQQNQQQQQREREQTEEAQFADVFEEMLREQGLGQDTAANAGTPATRNFWSVVGGLSGGALGFIVGNVPGMVAGAVAGNRLGAVRDTKGKSVYEVFQELPQSERSKLLSQLAAKVLSHAAGI